MRGLIELAFGIASCEACADRADGDPLCRSCRHNLSRGRHLEQIFDGFYQEANGASATASAAHRLYCGILESARRFLYRSAEVERDEARSELREVSIYATTLEDQITDMGIQISELTNSRESAGG